MGPIGWILSLVGSEIPGPDEPREGSAHPDRLDSAEVVRRALSVVGQGRYKLGKGGRHPLASHPFDDGRCDCSGFASWAMGLDRYQPGKIAGDWISTDAIVADATGPRRMFEAVTDARPGDLVVYPGRRVAGRRVAIGHVGVVTVPGATIATCRAAHCAASGPVAVRVSDGSPWARRGIVVRRR